MIMRSHHLIRVLFLLLCGLPAVLFAQSTPVTHKVDQSVHNLSAKGITNPPGTVHVSTDVGVCIFCHAPHNAQKNTPIWNRQLPPDNYSTYNSTTYKQTKNPVISTQSKLCLSCHDGTIALGQTIATGDLGTTPAMNPQNVLGTNLAVDHPISFTLPAQDDGELRPWIVNGPLTSPDPKIKLFSDKVECSTCHDPHVPDYDQVAQKFLRRDNANSAICLNCHDATRGDLQNYAISAHAASPSTIDGVLGMTYSSVSQNSCLTCHDSHNTAGGGPRLLRGVEEAACLNCHASNSPTHNPTARDVNSVLTTAAYKHPVITVSGKHDTAETLPVSTDRHSECEDCHNSHTARPSDANPSVAPAVQAALIGSHGVSQNGAVLAGGATNEFEVCFKCHAASPNKPQRQGYDQTYGRTAFRQSMQAVPDPYNTAEEFKAVISHNVIHVLSGNSVPSLRSNMLDSTGAPNGRSLATGNLYCSDCHNSDQARNTGGGLTGANGPHGSNWEHLLERRYDVNVPGTLPGDLVTPVAYSTGPKGTFALCDKCHDLNGLLVTRADKVAQLHQRHVVQDLMSCSACHTSHGVQGGDTAHHGHMVDPDMAIVKPGVGSTGDILIDTSNHTCNLTCHGHPHVDKTYLP